MYVTYADVSSWIDADAAPLEERSGGLRAWGLEGHHWTDSPPDLPMFGFLVASAIAVPLWGVIAWTAWVFLG